MDHGKVGSAKFLAQAAGIFKFPTLILIKIDVWGILKAFHDVFSTLTKSCARSSDAVAVWPLGLGNILHCFVSALWPGHKLFASKISRRRARQHKWRQGQAIAEPMRRIRPAMSWALSFMQVLIILLLVGFIRPGALQGPVDWALYHRTEEILDYCRQIAIQKPSLARYTSYGRLDETASNSTSHAWRRLLTQKVESKIQCSHAQMPWSHSRAFRSWLYQLL